MVKPSESTTLDPIPTQSGVKDQKDNKAVATFLKLIRDNDSQKSEIDQKNRLVRDMIESGFEIGEPTGPRRINTKKLYQAFWKTMQRVRLLDFTLHASNRAEHYEKMATDGITTMLRQGGYVSMFRDKAGLFQNGFGYGYAFGTFGTREGKGVPFEFQALANDNVYVDTRATAMRSGSKPVKRAVVITSMTWAEFAADYPEWKDKVMPGRIPRDTYSTELDQAEEQDQNEHDIIEVADGYDSISQTYVRFAGSHCVVMEEITGKEYPFKFMDKTRQEETPYIPVIHFKCMPSFKGFYDHGIFAAIYDLAMLYQKILNQMGNFTVEGVDPVRWISVPAGEASKVFAKWDAALQMRAQGKTPLVPLEYDPANPGGNQINAQALQVNSLINEAQIMFDRIDLEIRRFGIQIDEADNNELATAILADEENANRFVKQVMEMNASEFEFIMKVVIDQIPKTVKESDDTLVQMTTKVLVDEQGEDPFMLDASSVTYGMISKELKEYPYFPKINARSGADMNKLKSAQIARVLQMTQPGTKAYFDLMAQFSHSNDIDQDQFAFGAQRQQPQQQPQGGQPASQDLAPEPSATDALTINPRAAEQTPVF